MSQSTGYVPFGRSRALTQDPRVAFGRCSAGDTPTPIYSELPMQFEAQSPRKWLQRFIGDVAGGIRELAQLTGAVIGAVALLAGRRVRRTWQRLRWRLRW